MIAIRAFSANDAESVELIVTSCTRELRTIYAPKPRTEGVPPNHSSSGSRVVAVDHTDTLVGVAEWLAHPEALYVQGIAVAPMQRRRGVAASLLDHLAALAATMGLPALQVATIKETGNVEIFHRLGFAVIEERTSERYLGRLGQPVIEVTLKRHLA